MAARRGVGRFVSDTLPRIGIERIRPFEEVLGSPGQQIRLGGQPKVFLSSLEEARKFRNKIMHFSTNPVRPEVLERLRHVVRWLEAICSSQTPRGTAD